MTNLIQAPVPGQSLTDSPRNSPWERPSELSEVKDVVSYYIERLADDDIMDDMSVLFDLGADLETVTETLQMTGAMKGVHTAEAGMLAGPIVASFLKTALATYGIDAPERNVSDEKRMEDKEHGRISKLINAALEKSEQGDPGGELLSEMAAVEGDAPEMMPMEEEMPMAQEEEPMVEEPIEATAEQGNGIMSRGNV
tara:strand:+ start:113 stop:703 length:591 start_codon:yes stop_codon:yes gene_type:complete